MTRRHARSVRHRLWAGAASLAVAAVCAAPVQAETPRKTVDFSVDGLTCSTFLAGNPASREPVPGTSSVEGTFAVPTVVGPAEDVTVSDLRVSLTTDAAADLAARYGFTSFDATTAASVTWNTFTGPATISELYTTPPAELGPRPIGGTPTDVFSTPATGTTGRGYSGWNFTSPPTGTEPMVPYFRKFSVFGTATPGLAGAARTGVGLDCLVPEGVAEPLTSVPVATNLPVVTSFSPGQVYMYVPTVVTVRGRNFKNVRAVEFGRGGRALGYWVVSSTQIVAISPPLGYGVWPVQVTTSTASSVPTYPGLFSSAWPTWW